MFEVLLEKRAARDLKDLPSDTKRQVLHKVFLILSSNPFPRGKNPKKLKGIKAYRLRVGDYRVLYEVQDKIVLIYAIKHRKDIYRK